MAFIDKTDAMEIPGYKILNTLGQGGMATVYLAIQESFERKVAIKVMAPQLAADPSFGDRFQREAKIVSQLNHPNIVTVYDVGHVNDHHYLAMEYVPGKELRYRRQELSLLEKIKVTKEMASALHYAGNKGYVHRDVKPENIMLNEEDGRAILMDFGIARATDSNHSMTKTGTAIGTPYYMSPEQAQGKPVDRRSDIYSLGVVFFQLLAGHVPYDAESSVAIGIKHLTEPVPFLPKHLRVFQAIMEKVMAKEPDKRYQTGFDFIQDLDKVNLMELDKVEALAQKEAEIAATTDPSAPTIAPPVLNTGNVTTADAQRMASKLQADPSDAHLRKNNVNKPIFLAIVVLLALVIGAGLYTQKNKPADVARNNVDGALIDSAISGVVLKEDVVNTEKPSLVAPLPNPKLTSQVSSPIEVEKPDPVAVLLKEAENLSSSLPADNRNVSEVEKILSLYREVLTLDSTEKQAIDGIQAQLDFYLSKAELDLQNNNLTSPEKNNAYETYQTVLVLDSNNAEALQGLNTIAERYADLASNKRENKLLPAALLLVEKGLSVDKKNQPLLAMEKELKSDIGKLAEAEAKKLKDKQKKEQAQLAAQKIAEEQAIAKAKKKADKVDRLLKVATDLKEQGLLIMPANNNALKAYGEVLTVDANNSKAKKGISVIESNVLLGIRYQIEEGQLDEAREKLTDAQQLFPKSSGVVELLALYTQKTKEAKAAAVAASQPLVTKFTTHHQDFRSMALLSQDTLNISRSAYFGFIFKNFEGATSLLQAVLYDSSRTVKIAQKSVVVIGSDGEAFFAITRPVEGFQDGVYNVDLLLNSKVIHQTQFTVSH